MIGNSPVLGQASRDQGLPFSRRHFLQALVLGGVGMAVGAGPAEARPDMAFSTRLVWNAASRQLVTRRRLAWTRYVPELSRLYAATPYYCVTVHHQGSRINKNYLYTDVARDLRNVLVAHLEEGYGDIAYHFIVDQAGAVWEGRSLAYQGAHVSGKNPGNVGIMLLGNYEKQKPAPAQLRTLSVLSRTLCQCLAVSPRRIYGHRDLAQTLCPGRYLYPQLANLRPRA